MMRISSLQLTHVIIPLPKSFRRECNMQNAHNFKTLEVRRFDEFEIELSIIELKRAHVQPTMMHQRHNRHF